MGRGEMRVKLVDGRARTWEMVGVEFVSSGRLVIRFLNCFRAIFGL